MSELLIEELFNHVQNCLVENKKTQRKREEKRRQREGELFELFIEELLNHFKII